MNKKLLLVAALISVNAIRLDAGFWDSSVGFWNPKPAAKRNVPTPNAICRACAKVRSALTLENVKSLPGAVVNKVLWAPTEVCKFRGQKLNATTVATKLAAAAIVAAYCAGIYYVVTTLCQEEGTTETKKGCMDDLCFADEEYC